MKRTIFLFVLLFIFNSSYGQYANFDSSYTLISSPEYNYKNPVFHKGNPSVNYYIRDCLFAYERFNSESTAIIARLMTADSLSQESVIINNSDSNINPTLAYANISSNNNPGMLVYQSNQDNNWNLYYALFNGNTWTAPEKIFNDSIERKNPSICVAENWNTAFGYALVYEKSSSIYLSLYSNNQWSEEYRISGDSAYSYKSPVIIPNMFNIPIQVFSAFLKEISDTLNNAEYRQISINFPDDISLFQLNTISQPFDQDNLNASMGINFPILNYDYNTPGKKIFYSAFLGASQYSVWDQAGFLPGNTFNGRGSSHGDITDNTPSGYTVTAWLNEINDSLFAYFVHNYWDPFNVKKFSVTPSIAYRDLELSPKLVFGGPYSSYRIRGVWNDIENDRYVIRTSYADGNLTGIKNEQSGLPADYSLEQNFPNPFNPETTIKFSIPEDTDVELKIYNSLGREVKSYARADLRAGTYSIKVNMNDLGSGIYFYSLHSASFTSTRKMIFLK